MSAEDNVGQLLSEPTAKRFLGYLKLSGPGYLQSAMTLGGGSVASCAAMGSLLGYELLWVQPLGMLLGYFILASIAKQTCHTQERPYRVIWERLHPSLAILWGASAMIATVLWHIPQYSLTANGAVVLAEGISLDLSGTGARIGIGVVTLSAATLIVYMYNSGAQGLKAYERAVKILLWGIVLSFGIVVLATGVDFGRFFLGVTGISFIQDLLSDEGLDPRAVSPIVGGIAATVGINMVFLYPYSLLNKKWGPKHKELAYFDLITGMAIPFILATGLMVLAVANTIGPVAGEASETMIRDIREIVPVVGPTFGSFIGNEAVGNSAALLIVGLGITSIGFSTIITHMLACGFIGCEMFGVEHKGTARWVFSLIPAVGVVGVAIPFPIPLAITASTMAAPLMPVTIVCFLILLNNRAYMGDEVPRGRMRALWNTMLTIAVVILSVNAAFALQSNWGKFQGLFEKEEAAILAPLQVEEETASAATQAPFATLTHTTPIQDEFPFTRYAHLSEEHLHHPEREAQPLTPIPPIC